MQEKRIIRSAADSLVRLGEAKAQVASSTNPAPVKRQINNLTKPGTPSSTLKKAGVALIVATPDPFTAVPGVAMIAASYALKRKDPAKLDDLAAEARKIIRDLESFRL
ncbi:MAG: hypothetical protein OK452_04630 [Thaumarchaeota archaeon]|nr:hypothetical protein [Nitrososphaerota archaeon]